MRLNQLILAVVKAPEEYTGAKHIEMPEAGGSIGRSPGCTLTLADHNRFISGTHCLISVYGETNYISDVSTNGILINGNKVLRNQPVSLYNGDIISLGQYELHVLYEHISISQDIAADIAPERDSTDPLKNLGSPVVEEELQVGALEDLFMETKLKDIDGHDPVAHLNFSMQRDDDHLIKDDIVKKPSPPPTAKNPRQLIDDSFSLDSEFDMPSLIPEDWLSDSPKAAAPIIEPIFAERRAKQAAPSEPFIAPRDNFAPSAAYSEPSPVNHQSWEEVTQPFEPRSQAEAPSSLPSSLELAASQARVHSAEAQSSTLSDAFYQGLGITSPELTSHDEQFFRQMGSCLRLCMERLQKELNEAESMKQDGELAATANLTELMLTLNSQKLLAPQELVEQMLDELHDHRVLYDRAVSHFVVDQINACEPKKFASDFSRNTKFATKSKLWSAYTAHYDENRLKFNDNSVKKLIKENYEKIVQEKHS